MPALSCQPIETANLPWMPLASGIATRPLRFAGEERTQLLKVEPGTSVGLHSHGGFVHAYTLSGARRLDRGVIAGPGSYVFEPKGNRDCWECFGAEPVIIFIHMSGALISLDARGQETGRTTTESLRAQYLRWCEAEGHQPVALGTV
jgi:quercetin dioxygenase-like cupin family protein